MLKREVLDGTEDLRETRPRLDPELDEIGTVDQARRHGDSRARSR